MDDYDDNSAISDDYYSNEFSSIDDSLDGSDDYDYGSIDDSGSDYSDMNSASLSMIYDDDEDDYDDISDYDDDEYDLISDYDDYESIEDDYEDYGDIYDDDDYEDIDDYDEDYDYGSIDDSVDDSDYDQIVDYDSSDSGSMAEIDDSDSYDDSAYQSYGSIDEDDSDDYDQSYGSIDESSDDYSDKFYSIDEDYPGVWAINEAGKEPPMGLLDFHKYQKHHWGLVAGGIITILVLVAYALVFRNGAKYKHILPSSGKKKDGYEKMDAVSSDEYTYDSETPRSQ